MVRAGVQVASETAAELTMQAKSENQNHHLWPEERWHLHRLIQDGRGRGVNDLSAGALIILATVISVVYWVGR
jgi:hypothetical protein